MRIDYKLCSGCTACETVGPTNAIEMVQNTRGFWIPKIDEELCINCGKCERVCMYKTKRFYNNMVSAYAFIHNKESVLEESSSGGMFTAVSDIILSDGGTVYGAVLDKDMKVCHKRAASKAERDLMRGSKYVQSYLGNTYQDIKRDLKAGKWVLFTGTPCQIDGIKHFLTNDEQEKLLTCDLVCNGVPSPLIWEEHVKLLEKKYHRKMIGYKFRSKEWGWSVHRECAYFENNKKEYSTAIVDLFKKLYYSRLVMRTSCYSCPYTTMNRVGDITIADCRNIEKIYPEMNTYKGVSLVLVNTEKGGKIFDEVAKQGTCYTVDVQKIIQEPLVRAGKQADKSEEFWENFVNKGYEYAIKKQYGIFYEIKYFIKKAINRN